MGKKHTDCARCPDGAAAIPPSAPPLSRLHAYVLDWLVGGIVSGLPAVLLYLAVTQRSDMFSSLYAFEALGYPWALGMGAGALCIMAAVIYFVMVPLMVWPGQTLGKRIARIKVVGASGAAPGLLVLLVRQIAGFLLEGSGFIVSRYIREMAVLVTRVDVNHYWEIAGMVITLLSGLLALVPVSRRALHDHLAGTRVIPAEGHPLHQG